VGIDHNPHSIASAKAAGLLAYTVEEFKSSEYHVPERFDALLFSHIAEHMSGEQFLQLLAEYLPLLKIDGKVVVITPQELGFRSDPSHVQFQDAATMEELLKSAQLQLERTYSFPFPRFFFFFFKYNEFVCVARKHQN